MDGHELDAESLIGVRIGQCKQQRKLLVESAAERGNAVCWNEVEHAEVRLGIFIAGGVDAMWAVQADPGALDPRTEGGREGRPIADIDGLFQNGTDAPRSRLAIGTEPVDTGLEQLEHREVAGSPIIVPGESMQVGKRQSAPWGAQDGEPRDAVHGMDEGASESGEVDDFLALA